MDESHHPAWLTNACIHALALCAIGAFLASAAWAAPASTYEQERAACLDGSSHQDRATCLKEAGAARQEAQRGRLGSTAADDTYRRNALQRCQSLPEADRAACAARVSGSGTTTGSVQSGGVLRETRQIVLPDGREIPPPSEPAPLSQGRPRD